MSSLQPGPLQPEESPGLLLWRVTLAWQRRVTGALREFDLTHVQFVLLTSTWWLTDQAGEKPTQKRLAEFSGTDVMMTSQVVRKLQSAGLVTRTTDDHDARAMVVTITDTGRTLALTAVTAVETVDEKFFGRVDRTTALALLRTLDNPR